MPVDALWNNPRMKPLAFALLLLACSALAHRSEAGQGASSATLAPTGTLRAVFLGTNPVHARVDTRTGAIAGPVAELTVELARRLGVPYRLIPAPDARGVIAHLQAGTADIGFLAYEAARAQEVDFVGGFAVMFSTHLVRRDSPLRTVADADHAGLVVGAVRGQSQEIFLSANLKQSRVRMFETQPPAADLQRLLESGELAAFGMNQQRAEDAVAATGSALRFLEGSFLNAEQSFVVRKGDTARAAEIRPFLESVRASGFIQAAIDRAKLAGVVVAR
jgi:polar amino acid transport system substrate-binding protein